MTFYVRRGNKFGNKTTTFNGRSYMSKKEAGFARDIELAKRAVNPRDRVVEVVSQVLIDIYIDGVTLTTRPTSRKLFRIIPDFKITYADGRVEIVEVKGFATEMWRFKWKIFEAVYNHEYPDIDLHVIK